MKWYLIVGLTVLVMVSTLLIRFPIPGGGYFNLGDVVIVFTGLYAGKKIGFLAGGIGSALADLIGFPVFAPITFVVKGIEGFLCGLGQGSNKLLSYLMPALGVLFMVFGYFLGCLLFPNLGKVVAIADLPVNLVQALVGYVGGRALFIAYERVSGI
ncbi:MAG: ECF transporter S component [Candidatus Cloacimonas sp.]|jgi:uncharacterized membrane protein|nr:ECF transporter S component [Candidatus Cloacimonas sp.]